MRARPKLLIPESIEFSPAALRTLSWVTDVIRTDRTGVDFQRLLPLCDILWVRLQHHVDAAMLRRARNLKVIVTATTGLNHIDLQEAERMGVRVLSLNGETDFLREVRATAEHTIALMLALMRHIPAAVRHVESGGWNRNLFKGNELYGKTVGIVGYGRLGRIVARYLAAFDVDMFANDPAPDAAKAEPKVTPLALPELLRRSDVVSLHVNLTKQTEKFFGHQQFAMMKKGSWFINTSRGELVDESALLDALESGTLAGAALDVVSGEAPEPPAGSRLMSYMQTHSNLIITPHLGGCTLESMEKTEAYLAQKLSDLWVSFHGPAAAHFAPR